MPAYQFKIQLKYVQPPVWRKVLVPSDITFSMLHDVIQVSFGWQNSHLYKFSPTGGRSKPSIQPPFEDSFGEPIDSDTITLSEIFRQQGETFVYQYDFGDDWVHDIKFEKISDQIAWPVVCMDGAGACPPEDCGGPPGYMHLLEVLANPKDPEYKGMREWLGLTKGKQWDINAFDLEAVNARFRSMCS
jgi:hypothetical protein